MKAEYRVWWEALADQYEAWADEPPMLDSGIEEYTCIALDNMLGFTPLSCAILPTRRLFKFCGYKDLDFPAGSPYDDNRATKREAFCQDMADTIRENL